MVLKVFKMPSGLEVPCDTARHFAEPVIQGAIPAVCILVNRSGWSMPYLFR